jgi:hypothetical protein
MVQMTRIFSALALCFAVAIVPRPSSAGDSWNIAMPGGEEDSRKASAALFDGASLVFAALASGERLDYDSATTNFQSASQALLSAAAELKALAGAPAGAIAIDAGDSEIPPDDLVFLVRWYNQHTGSRVSEVKQIPISQLLRAASEEAMQISQLLNGDGFQAVRADNPPRARIVIDRYSWFLTAGTVASQAFAVTLARHPPPK